MYITLIKKKKKCFSEGKARYLDPRDYGKDWLVYELQNSLTYKISFNMKLSMYKFVMSRKLQGTKTHYFLNEEKNKKKLIMLASEWKSQIHEESLKYGRW